MSEPVVVFFDGLCGLCDRFVGFLLRRDHRHRLRFAPLQGTTAAALTGIPPRTDSVIVVRDGQVLLRSEAAITALAALGGLWRAALLLRVVPRTLRDAGYDLVARHRHTWFGRRTTCRVPSEQERARFLP